MKSRSVRQVIALISIFTFLVGLMPIEKGIQEVCLSPSSGFVAETTSFAPKPNSKKWALVGGAALMVGQLFGPAFLPSQSNPAVAWAQDQSQKDQIKGWVREAYDDLKYMRENPDVSHQEKENHFIAVIQRMKASNQVYSIRYLLELTNSIDIDYGQHERLYSALLDALISIIESNKDETIPNLYVKKFWQPDPDAPIKYEVFFRFPRNVRVGDIPDLLFREMLRRIELEATRGPQGENINNFLVTRLAAQSFRLHAIASRKGLVSNFDPALVARAVGSTQSVVSRARTQDGEYIKRRLVFGLIQSFHDWSLDSSNRAQMLRSFSRLKTFSQEESFLNSAHPEVFIEITKTRISQRLMLAEIRLNPETIEPKKKEEEKIEPIQEVESIQDYFSWMFAAFLALLAGGGISWLLVQKDKKKKHSFARPLGGKKRATLPLEMGETNLNPTYKPKPFPKFQDEQIGPFILKRVVGESPEGFVREAYYRQGQAVKKIGLIQKGPLLIEYPIGSSRGETVVQKLEEGSFARKAYYLSSKGGFQSSLVALKGDRVIFLPAVGTSTIGEVREGNGTVPVAKNIYSIYKVNEESGLLSQTNNSILDGDLLIDPEPDATLPQMGNGLGASYRAYSTSLDLYLNVTPFITSKNKVYWITEKLGQGGMGAVFKAWDSQAKRYVAIKIVLDPDDKAQFRFNLEAKASARLSHENVVQVYSYGPNPLLHMVMEMANGKSLENLSPGELDLEQILEVGIQTAKGLKYIHANGLLHRDLKPANLIWVEEDKKVKIADLGLVREVGAERMTLTGELLGTPAYMPPEQAIGKKEGESADELDVRADLYSLGAILYELTTGKPPYFAPNAMAVMLMILEESSHSAREPLSKLRKGVPKEFEDLVNKVMAYDRENRFQSAEEVETELKKIRTKLRRKLISPRASYQIIQLSKRLLIASAFIAVALALAPIVMLVLAKREREALSAQNASVPNEPKPIEPTPWEEWKDLSYQKVLIKIEADLTQLERLKKPIQYYYRAYIKWNRSKENLSDIEKTQLWQDGLSDLRNALRIADPGGKLLKLEWIQYYLLKAKIEAALGRTDEARSTLNKVKNRLDDEGRNNRDLDAEGLKLKRELEALFRTLDSISFIQPPGSNKIYVIDPTFFERSA